MTPAPTTGSGPSGVRSACELASAARSGDWKRLRPPAPGAERWRPIRRPCLRTEHLARHCGKDALVVVLTVGPKAREVEQEAAHRARHLPLCPHLLDVTRDASHALDPDLSRILRDDPGVGACEGSIVARPALVVAKRPDGERRHRSGHEDADDPKGPPHDGASPNSRTERSLIPADLRER
jgi:hypothetical protein